MRTKGAVYFLVLLLVWAQVDDAWAATPLSPLAAPLADDADEEYLPAESQQHREQWAQGQAPAPPGVRPETGGVSSGIPQRGPSAESRAAAPFAPPPLYVFMSLQR
jgi:hypothetical protein